MSIDVKYLPIREIKVLQIKKHGDSRGFFSETYNKQAFAEVGITVDFVQDNHVLSGPKGTVRGLHFQTPPFDQAKLIRVCRGAIFDVAVDLRVGSPNYGKHETAVLSADAWNQIYIPSGFAHGLATLEPNTEVIYKVSNFYAPKNDAGVLWNDPDLGIDWPIKADEALLSPKDKVQPRFADLPVHFRYGA
jgi:dTDP-4-dehydrorhamnose 3,5-epimerase